jgi:hypothetical protein
MIRVVAAVGGQVERHRETFLSRGKVAPVERVGLGRRGEPGVLTDCPRLVDIHRRVRPSNKRRLAGKGVQWVTTGLDAGAVGGDVHRLDVDVLRGVPHQLVRGVPVSGRGRRDVLFHGVLGRLRDAAVAVQRDVGEVADNGRGGRHRR